MKILWKQKDNRYDVSIVDDNGITVNGSEITVFDMSGDNRQSNYGKFNVWYAGGWSDRWHREYDINDLMTLEDVKISCEAFLRASIMKKYHEARKILEVFGPLYECLDSM